MEHNHTIKDVISAAGGPIVVANATGLTSRAIYKWMHKNRMPYTEMTGDTCYAETVSKLTKGAFTKRKILSIGTPIKDEAA